MTTINCEFCNEFQGNNFNTFNKLYESVIENRTLLESPSFKIIPTLGQLFKNSLLILPIKHIETLSELNDSELDELVALYNQVKTTLSKLGHVVAFEHGAHANTGGGCGIYHAHLHLIPLPKEVNLFDFYLHQYRTVPKMDDAFRALKGIPEYLIAINEDYSIGFLDLTDLSGIYASQYFRRVLCDKFNLTAPWDWKKYNYVEELVLESVTDNVFM